MHQPDSCKPVCVHISSVELYRCTVYSVQCTVYSVQCTVLHHCVHCTQWCNTGQETSHGKPRGRSSWSHGLVRARLWCQSTITQPPGISHCIAIPLGPMCDYSSYDYHPVMGPLPACHWLTQMFRPLVGRRRGSNNRLSALAGRDAVQCSAVQ